MTEVFKKLNYKDQEPILILAAPPSFESELREISKRAEIHPAVKTLLPALEKDAVLAELAV